MRDQSGRAGGGGSVLEGVPTAPRTSQGPFTRLDSARGLGGGEVGRIKLVECLLLCHALPWVISIVSFNPYKIPAE